MIRVVRDTVKLFLLKRRRPCSSAITDVLGSSCHLLEHPDGMATSRASPGGDEPDPEMAVSHLCVPGFKVACGLSVLFSYDSGYINLHAF